MHRADADAPPVVMAIVGGEDAVALESLSDDEIKFKACASLQAMIVAAGGEFAVDEVLNRCKSCVASRWCKDDLALGSFSHLPPGSTPADYDSLAKPEWSGRLGFCGEHTSRKYPNTMHGALLSGDREAKRVLSEGANGRYANGR
mmetsp:Transcript_16717/g.57201  ORF Transcript_16717/g.57201 Transcript_16717/m.57201 type:complete len:145 (+) Transcript_16717:1188-1622(+)